MLAYAVNRGMGVVDFSDEHPESVVSSIIEFLDELKPVNTVKRMVAQVIDEKRKIHVVDVDIVTEHSRALSGSDQLALRNEQQSAAAMLGTRILAQLKYAAAGMQAPVTVAVEPSPIQLRKHKCAVVRLRNEYPECGPVGRIYW